MDLQVAIINVISQIPMSIWLCNDGRIVVASTRPWCRPSHRHLLATAVVRKVPPPSSSPSEKSCSDGIMSSPSVPVHHNPTPGKVAD